MEEKQYTQAETERLNKRLRTLHGDLVLALTAISRHPDAPQHIRRLAQSALNNEPGAFL